MTESAARPDPAYAGPQRVFSGVQPTNGLHLGNYLGALKNFAALQNKYDCLYCVVDMHAITAKLDPENLAHNTREAAAAFIASGVDPKRSAVFAQSAVAQHAELAWIFNCIARMGWLNRMTQFKEKAGKDRENASVGLFTYPALMAADILAYKATHVPVGEDQKQHLELARDVAQKFNTDFGVDLSAVARCWRDDWQLHRESCGLRQRFDVSGDGCRSDGWRTLHKQPTVEGWPGCIRPLSNRFQPRTSHPQQGQFLTLGLYPVDDGKNDPACKHNENAQRQHPGKQSLCPGAKAGHRTQILA